MRSLLLLVVPALVLAAGCRKPTSQPSQSSATPVAAGDAGPTRVMSPAERAACESRRLHCQKKCDKAQDQCRADPSECHMAEALCKSCETCP